MGVFGRVAGVLPKGLPRPSMVVLRPGEITQFDLLPLMQARPPDRVRMMAAIGGQPDAECTMLAGALRLRRPRERDAGMALVVYIEWPDNRWWTAWSFLERDGAKGSSQAPMIRRAVDGSPRPAGVGGWFARARREGLVLRLDRPAHLQGLDLVH